jgi:hypothetical protein
MGPRERNDLIYIFGASAVAMGLIWGLYWYFG